MHVGAVYNMNIANTAISTGENVQCLDLLSSLLLSLLLSSDSVLSVLVLCFLLDSPPPSSRLGLCLEEALEGTLDGGPEGALDRTFEEALEGTLDPRLEGSLEGSLVATRDSPRDVSYTYFVVVDFSLFCDPPGTRSSVPCRGTSS
jgi:hypothetical protein